jgi:hypothetical protein
LNNNRFWGPSLESANCATIAFRDYGWYTRLDHPRLEAVGDTGGLFKIELLGRYADVHGGYGMIKESVTDTGIGNNVYTKTGIRIKGEASSGQGVIVSQAISTNGANLFEGFNVAGTSVYKVDGTGMTSTKKLVLTGADTATAAAAGSASVLPAAPAGYLYLSINGGTYRIPYYN